MQRSKISGLLASTLAASLLLVISTTAIAATSHKVVPGDSLWTIAKKYNTTTAAIARANGIKESKTLKLGEKLTIPSKSTPTKNAASQTKSTTGTYVVKAGDSLWTIAKKHNTTAEKLAKANGLTEKSVLKLGKKLVIPGQTVTSKPSSTAKKQVAQKKPAKSSTPTKVASNNTSKNNDLISTALALRGSRYRRGGTSRGGGFDCSGFVSHVYSQYGIKLPHSSAAQAKLGVAVDKANLKPGDLVFFQTNGRSISHVGIFIGNGKFVHASNTGRGVTTDLLSSSYYAPRYRGARRVK